MLMDEPEIVFMPGMATPTDLIEACWNQTMGEAYFYWLNLEQGLDPIMVETVPDEATGKEIAPLEDELLRNGAISLPTKPVEYGS